MTNPLPLSTQSEIDLKRYVWYVRCWTGSLLVLFTITFKSWNPEEQRPRVPILEMLTEIPFLRELEWALLTGVFSFSLLLFLRPTIWLVVSRKGAIGLTACLAMLLALDQFHWQAWAYQFLLIGVVASFSTPRRAAWLWRALIIGIYIYAALGKLDTTFTDTLGQQFLQVLTGPFFDTLEKSSLTLRRCCALLFPLGELVAGVLLLSSKTRRAGLYAAWLMHLILLYTVGPFGLNHQHGVLFWNLSFLVQITLLFYKPKNSTIQTEPLQTESWQTDRSESLFSNPKKMPQVYQTWSQFLTKIPEITIGIALLMPLFCRAGYWDTWPSWGLYAPSYPRATLYVEHHASKQLPQQFQKYLIRSARWNEKNDLKQWDKLHLNRWSLERFGVPMVPQNRLVLAVAEKLLLSQQPKEPAQEKGLANSLRVEVESAANRWNKKRTSTIYQGADEIRAATRKASWLNTKAYPGLLP